MIESQLAELKDLILATHRKVANIEMQMRNPCTTCYYKNTHPKPAVPTMTDAEVRRKMVRDIDQRPSPETSNKFQEDTDPDFIPNVLVEPVTATHNSVVERIFSRKDKTPTIETTGGQK